jgi:hypothetical protein
MVIAYCQFIPILSYTEWLIRRLTFCCENNSLWYHDRDAKSCHENHPAGGRFWLDLGIRVSRLFLGFSGKAPEQAPWWRQSTWGSSFKFNSWEASSHFLNIRSSRLWVNLWFLIKYRNYWLNSNAVLWDSFVIESGDPQQVVEQTSEHKRWFHQIEENQQMPQSVFWH